MPATKAKTRRAVSTPPASIDDQTVMGRILDMLQDVKSNVTGLADRMEALEGKVKEQGQAIPKFQPMAKDDVSQPKAATKDLQTVGQQKFDGKQLPVGSDGLRIVGYRPIFHDGDRVRMNPDSEMAQTLSRNGKDPTKFVGTVQGLHFYSEKRGEMKFRVHFPGETRGTRGDGYWESDLLPL